MILYPILLDLKGELCVIVGGGDVARRKVEHLLEAGARVRVVAPQACTAIRKSAKAGDLELRRRKYDCDQLDGGARLVFGCTDDARVNAAVVADARERKIPANRIDSPAGGDFHVPSMVRRESLLLTVSTGGKAPALSRELCHRLEQQFGPAWGSFTNVLGRLREGWKKKGENAKIHGRMLEIIGSDTFEVLQSAGDQAATKHARGIVRRLEAEPKAKASSAKR